jgi:hypothetical protein
MNDYDVLAELETKRSGASAPHVQLQYWYIFDYTYNRH